MSGFWARKKPVKGALITAFNEYGDELATVIVPGARQEEIIHLGRDGDPVQAYAHNLDDIHDVEEQHVAMDILAAIHAVDVKNGAYEE